VSRSLGVGSEKITMRYSGSPLTPRENRFCPDKSGLPYPHADLMGGKAWVAVPMNKSGRDSDGREMMSAPGPKDCVSEDSGLFRRGSSGRGEREIPPSAPAGSPFPS
jgi:hypothetical protein